MMEHEMPNVLRSTKPYIVRHLYYFNNLSQPTKELPTHEHKFRLAVLAEMFGSKRILPAAMRFVDIAGLVAGASKGEGLGNKFLSHIRQVDAIAQVIRCFDDPNITHVAGSVDPVRDIEIINTELCLADLESVDKRLQRIAKLAKSGDKDARMEAPILEKVSAALGDAIPVRAQGLTDDELEILKDLTLLTAKKSLYVANVGEDEVSDYSGNEFVKQVEDYAAKEGSGVVVVSARIESEIAELSDEEATAFLADLGLEESGLTKLIKASYSLLGLINYSTAGEMEARAWTIVEGTKAPQAAGKIHSDIEKGFIRAEIVSFDDLEACGSQNAAKEKGLVRLEGKDYIMKDGDVTHFRFNV